MPQECLFCNKIARLHELPDDEILWQFPFSVAFLGPWQFYHGYCVLASRLHATELSQLNDEARLYFLDEMCTLAKAVEDCFHPRKLNYEMLGNQVGHLHWHIIPRYKDDPEPAQPIWGTIERFKDDRQERRRLKTGPVSRERTIAALKDRLQFLTTHST